MTTTPPPNQKLDPHLVQPLIISAPTLTISQLMQFNSCACRRKSTGSVQSTKHSHNRETPAPVYLSVNRDDSHEDPQTSSSPYREAVARAVYIRQCAACEPDEAHHRLSQEKQPSSLQPISSQGEIKNPVSAVAA